MIRSMIVFVITNREILLSQIFSDETCFFCKPRNDGWVGGCRTMESRTVKLVFGTGCPDHQCRRVMPLPGTSKTTFQGKNSPSNFYVSTESFAVSLAHSCHSVATTYQLCIKI